MSDLIRREDAVEALDSKIVYMAGLSYYEKNITNPFAQYNKGLEDGIKIIRALPSAEPERKWIPCSEALPEDRRSVIVSSRSGSIYIATLVKGISQETRRKMKNGEINNLDVEGWCLADGWTTSKRSNIFQEGDEWGNNSKDYAWRDGPYHYSGQEILAWMPLPEPWRGE